MDQAMRAEHGRADEAAVQPPLMLEQASAEGVKIDAATVAWALQTAGIRPDTVVMNAQSGPVDLAHDPDGTTQGWSLTAHLIDPQYVGVEALPSNRQYGGNQQLLLSEGGSLYFYGGILQARSRKLVAENEILREYEAANVYPKDVARAAYGLARLVARHRLKLSDHFAVYL